ncbi:MULTISPECIES: hypothetical protein [Catenuloplanes]|uniref:Uncharacterized protein n=1 Tax=Catenuloplanes niger TaxID=587534 RepID=A0AAE3ZR21_9ACTN|nr:hypothetical protein [Catenuloplanes niger]MDR7323409.1 hypothetical protein [Catenuloplanes niger]
MTQPIRTSPAMLLPPEITSLYVQPKADGCYLLDRRDGVILAQIDAHKDGAGAWLIELCEDVVQLHKHTGTLATAIRWAEQGIAELDHFAMYGEMPDYVTVPRRPWPHTKTTEALADALEALAANLRAFDLTLPRHTDISLEVLVMNFGTDRAAVKATKMQAVDALIAGLALPAAEDRSRADSKMHYGTPHASDGGSRHQGGLDVAVTTIVDRDAAVLAVRVAELEAQLAAKGGAA